MSVAIDLDILRPEPKTLKLKGVSIDVSFIPCGITFEMDELIQKLAKISQKKILNGGADCEKAFDLSIKMCSLFMSNTNPEMDETWFKQNVDVVQINAFAKEIQNALEASYKGVSDYGKK